MIELYPMTEDNFTDAAAVEQACFSDRPWTAEQFREELSIDFSRTFIAYLDGGTNGVSAAGFVNVWITPPTATINNIAVMPEYRRQGIADLLIERAREVCEGLDELTLEVRVSNTPAISLYEKHGFKNVGRRRNFYENPREDAFIMTRGLRGNGDE